MEKDLVGGSIGSVGSYDIALKGGELVLALEAHAGPAKAKIEVDLDGKSVGIAFLEWLKIKIPGDLENLPIAILEEKIKSL